jgi:hypothetical protein
MIYLGNIEIGNGNYLGNMWMPDGNIFMSQSAVSPGGGIVTDELVLWYDAKDSDSYPGTGNTVTDLSGNGNDGTLQGGIDYSGSVFRLNGSTGYIQLPTTAKAPITGSGAATLMMWVKLTTSPPPSDPQTGFLQITQNSSVIGNHYPYTDGFIYTDALNSTRINSITPGVTMTNWHVVTISNSNGANNWKIYQNTGSIATATGITITSLYSTLKVGESGGDNDNLSGSVGAFLLYSKQLSDSEIKQNYDFYSASYGI